MLHQPVSVHCSRYKWTAPTSGVVFRIIILKGKTTSLPFQNIIVVFHWYLSTKRHSWVWICHFRLLVIYQNYSKAATRKGPQYARCCNIIFYTIIFLYPATSCLQRWLVSLHKQDISLMVAKRTICCPPMAVRGPFRSFSVIRRYRDSHSKY